MFQRLKTDVRSSAICLVLVALVAVSPAVASEVARYARNAGRIDGFSSDELVRASSAVNTGHRSDFNTRGYSTIQRARFEAPVKGVLMVWAGLNAQWDDDSEAGSYAEIVARLTVDNHAAGSSQRVEISRSTRAGTQIIGLSAAIPVKAGPHRIGVQAKTARGEALTYLQGRHIEFLFVPFGSQGVQGTL